MSTVSRTYPRASKVTRCTSCGRPIAKGERYHRWVGTGDAWPGLATAKECDRCCERYGRPIPAQRTPAALPLSPVDPGSSGGVGS